MSKAIYQSYQIDYITIFGRHGSMQEHKSKFQFAAKNDEDAKRELRHHFEIISRDQRYYWITAFTETTNSTIRIIEIPLDIKQSKLEVSPAQVA